MKTSFSIYLVNELKSCCQIKKKKKQLRSAKELKDEFEREASEI